jgi:hypothetical protein
MKERPILFSTDMVKALLDGRKTQTRRTTGLDEINQNPDKWTWIEERKHTVNRLWDSTTEPFSPNPLKTYFSFVNENGTEVKVRLPYGDSGDLLWVRETFGYEDFGTGHRLTYKTDGWELGKGQKWKPSIHMPKVDARIWLQVKEVNVERLQDISEEDARAEGVITPLIDQGVIGNGDDYTVPNEYVESRFKVKGTWKVGFKQLINQINGLDTWDKNPWVWVVKFEVLSTKSRAAAYAKLGKEVSV